MLIKSFGFSCQQRLRNKADFKLVFDQGRKIVDKRFILLFRPNRYDFFRLGIILSKAKMKQATARNRVKRLIRETFRQSPQALAGYDIVLMLRGPQPAGEKNLPDQLLHENIKNVCEKLIRFVHKP